MNSPRDHSSRKSTVVTLAGAPPEPWRRENEYLLNSSGSCFAGHG
jgi:hypothetical protein